MEHPVPRRVPCNGQAMGGQMLGGPKRSACDAGGERGMGTVAKGCGALGQPGVEQGRRLLAREQQLACRSLCQRRRAEHEHEDDEAGSNRGLKQHDGTCERYLTATQTSPPWPGNQQLSCPSAEACSMIRQWPGSFQRP